MRSSSDRPCKNGGWLHPIGSAPSPSGQARQWIPDDTEHHDFAVLMAGWKQNTTRLSAFAATLGVSKEALESMNCAWAGPHHAWAFPMKDGDGRTVGIRLRAENGKKWAVKGSKQGLFVSESPASATAYVCEGPTDTAAALSIGLWAVGRPSCAANNAGLKTMFARRGVRQAVILSDNDLPGINGAQRLASEIGLPCALLILPAKDTRQFVQLGGNRLLIENLLRQTLWRNP